MTVEVNGIAHIQLTVRDPGRCIPFWEALCHFLQMKTLIKNKQTVYCIGSRTGILVRGAPEDKRDLPFDQDRPGFASLLFSRSLTIGCGCNTRFCQRRTASQGYP